MTEDVITRCAVIMAGGSGERFWPVSRRLRPKQLLRLAHPEKSLLEQSVERIESLVPRNNVFVATARHLHAAIASESLGLPPENILCEPCKRNTAGALVYAAAHLLARFKDPDRLVMAVLTADHRIQDTGAFLRSVDAALSAAEKHGVLVVMGIRPTRPETGYGYIEVAKDKPPIWTSSSGVSVMPAAGFREKPDKTTAERFVRQGNFLWNSGMFFWRLDVFVEELRIASPQHAATLTEIADAIGAGDHAHADTIFERLPDISIDYALMEKSCRVAVVPATFDWDDVGAWDALERAYPRDEQGNVCVGEPIVLDSQNCIVYNDAGAANVAVGVVGCHDLAVIVSPDGVLVIPKDRAQDVRLVVAEMKKRGYTQL